MPGKANRQGQAGWGLSEYHRERATMRGNANRQGGFSLVEAIAALVIVGFAATGLTMLIAYGAKGYVQIRSNVNTAEKVQVAMDRIRIELETMQSITSLTKTAVNGSIAYLDFSGSAVTLAMNQGTGAITLGGNTLLDNVSGFTLATTCANMSGGSGAAPDLANITVTISETNIPNAFSIVVTPRTKFACF